MHVDVLLRPLEVKLQAIRLQGGKESPKSRKDESTPREKQIGDRDILAPNPVPERIFTCPLCERSRGVYNPFQGT